MEREVILCGMARQDRTESERRALGNLVTGSVDVKDRDEDKSDEKSQCELLARHDATCFSFKRVNTLINMQLVFPFISCGYRQVDKVQNAATPTCKVIRFKYVYTFQICLLSTKKGYFPRHLQGLYPVVSRDLRDEVTKCV